MISSTRFINSGRRNDDKAFSVLSLAFDSLFSENPLTDEDFSLPAFCKHICPAGTLGGAIGLLLGKFLHAFVMDKIDVDMVSFDVLIMPLSYLFSFILTFVFAMVVNRFMRGKLNRIDMAESLKSVE